MLMLKGANAFGSTASEIIECIKNYVPKVRGWDPRLMTRKPPAGVTRFEQQQDAHNELMSALRRDLEAIHESEV